MLNPGQFKVNQVKFVIALVSSAYGMSAYAAAGKVEFSLGDVTALGSDGRSRSLSKGAEINPGDTIQTVNGRAQVRFTDGGYISLQPNTEFKVEDYAYSGKTDGSEKGFFSLVKGGLRAITGAIGHGTNKSAYRVSTPVATIGIRGTEYTAMQQEGGGLNFHVGDGAVFVETSSGNKVFYQGQNGEVSGQGSAPQHTSETPGVGAAGPTNPNQQQQEQQQSQQNQQTFIAGDLKSSDGGVCGTAGATGGACGFVSGVSSVFDMRNEIEALHTQGVYGYYSGMGMSGSYGYSIYASIDFSSYSASLSGASICNGSCDGANDYIYTSAYSGSLNSSTGAISFSGYSGGGAGAWSGGSITSVTGQLNPVSGLPTANFTITGTKNGSDPVSVTGTATRSMGEGG